MTDAPCIGIDVGARRLHGVAVAGGAVVDARVFSARDLSAVVSWASGARVVAIDSPDRWSSAPHAGDGSLAPKFRTARCAEIGLGRQYGVWVAWATPCEPVPGSWMEIGITLFTALRANGHEPLEVYPFAVFWSLAGNRSLPNKRTPAGWKARLSLLAAAGVNMSADDDCSHDTIDAAAAALVARDQLHHRAEPATCGHDGSAIWLPSPLPPGVAEASASLRPR